ncbi:MAG: A/G-specific adenine glycosylase [Lachnospiraceae bacterium]|nr:A/G-specific adenine glycosylase [Lachnospiraceae bacterium]
MLPCIEEKMRQKEIDNLLNWYYANARKLPWRENPNAYGVWVSEIMLQQTRVEAVKPYYKRFLEKYPDVLALAEAKEEELLKYWEGLGYYNRVRNMQKAAIQIRDMHKGIFPTEYEVLIELAGIGPYTAGAIASIAGDEKVPAVDGNVLRIMTRLNGDYSNISEPATIKKIREELFACMPECAGDFNQALMELGATVCLPNGEPKCEECPWKSTCKAKKRTIISELPVKNKPQKRKVEERTLILLSGSNGVALRKRPVKGLLAGMYEIPALEGYRSEQEVLEYVKEIGYHPLHVKKIEDHVHIFSHIEWHMRAFLLRIDEISDSMKTDTANDFFFVEPEEIMVKYPLPSAFAPYRKYIETKK